ncbi:ABC transporter permease [Micromonospora olivasterospora]|uniref:Peptide/nickel transport system permease protein n=1 Tax=Micromonospora olivasterospora TaxID=1880 RepID=A0A562IIY6_MICOL|nr:ABC transporter permease [Micromonospora olivasterospora]TWH70594.1 peptide/nickel transport system permease protein [Micromonospora olivasterospora]
MLIYVAKRVAAGVVLLLVVVTLIFIAVHLVPGDPARTILTGTGSTPTEDAVAQLRTELGLNLPIWEQYSRYLSELAHGSLGHSLQDGRPVTEYVAERMPRTLQLVGATTLVSIVLGVTLGALAARRGGLLDRVVLFLGSVGVAIPAYVAAILLIFVIGVQLQWLPSGGYVDPGEGIGPYLRALALPVVALSIGFTSIVMRMTRSSVLETSRQDWVRTAEAVGLRRRTVFLRHVVRNALTPVLTVTGLQVGALLGGTVIVERVFSWPGLSGLLIDGVSSRDYPVVQGVVIVIAAMFIALNIMVDISYGLFDPRGRR